MRRVVALLAIVALTSCAIFERKNDISAIEFTGSACPECSDSLVVHANGLIEDTSNYQAPIRTMARREASQIIDAFPLDEFKSAAFFPQAPSGPDRFSTVTVTFRDGRSVTAAVPAGQRLYPRNAHLQRWLLFTAFAATDASFGKREQAFSVALRGARAERVRETSLEMRGCFGWCPRYVATFFPNDTATLRASGPHCSRSSQTRIPFDRVLTALRNGNAAALRPAYGVRVVDTESARIVVRTTRATYVSDAPDSASWGREFAATQGRLDQIVRDASWSPPIDLEQCAGKPKRINTV